MRAMTRRSRSRDVVSYENPGVFGSDFVQTSVGVAGGIILASLVTWVVQGIASAMSSKAA